MKHLIITLLVLLTYRWCRAQCIVQCIVQWSVELKITDFLREENKEIFYFLQQKPEKYDTNPRSSEIYKRIGQKWAVISHKLCMILVHLTSSRRTAKKVEFVQTTRGLARYMSAGTKVMRYISQMPHNLKLKFFSAKEVPKKQKLCKKLKV